MSTENDMMERAASPSGGRSSLLVNRDAGAVFPSDVGASVRDVGLDYFTIGLSEPDGTQTVAPTES